MAMGHTSVPGAACGTFAAGRGRKVTQDPERRAFYLRRDHGPRPSERVA
jgi:hypothetical protein